MSRLLTGKEVAAAINQRSSELLAKMDHKPVLAIVRVGQNEADLSYERTLIKRSETIGIETRVYEFDKDVCQEEFLSKLKAINEDKQTSAILMFRPLPKTIDEKKACSLIDLNKDVDCCNPNSLIGVFTNSRGFAPCTAQSVIEILDYYNIDVTGKNVVVLGRSLVIGKPVSMMLLNKNATVTICHTKTKNIQEITKKADIVIAATGQMESLNKDYFTKGQTVIDVGINFNTVKNKLCGDVLFEEVEGVVDDITPVPGGVGSVTTSVLINHVVLASYEN